MMRRRERDCWRRWVTQRGYAGRRERLRATRHRGASTIMRNTAPAFFIVVACRVAAVSTVRLVGDRRGGRRASVHTWRTQRALYREPPHKEREQREYREKPGHATTNLHDSSMDSSSLPASSGTTGLLVGDSLMRVDDASMTVWTEASTREVEDNGHHIGRTS